MLKSCLLVAALVVTQLFTVASAATWTGNIDSDWFNAGNWTGGVPTAGTSADFNDPDPAVIAVGAAVASAVNMTQGMLTINSGSLTVTTTSILGQGAFNPQLIQNGGVVTWNGGGLYVGSVTGSGADIYSYNGGTFTATQLTIRNDGQFDHGNSFSPVNVSGAMTVGAATSGDSVFNLNGNILNIGTALTIGVGSNTGTTAFNFGNVGTAALNFTSASGAINVNGTNNFVIPAGLVNPITVPTTSIIGSGAGYSKITQDGGTLAWNGGGLYVGSTADGMKDEYNFNNGTFTASQLTVRADGEFNHNKTGAAMNITGAMTVGAMPTGDSVFNLNGNILNIGTALTIGVGSNTGTTAFNFGNVGTAALNFTSASGAINVNGTNNFVIPAGLVNPITVPTTSIIGSGAGYSKITQDGGTLAWNGGGLYVGSTADGMKDEYNFNNGTFTASQLTVRADGEFNHNKTGANMNIVGSLNIGNTAAGASVFNLNGNELTIGTNLDIGVGANTGSGTFNFGNPATAKINFTGGASNGINIAGTNTLNVPVGLVNPLVIPGQSIIGTTDGFSVFNQNGGALDFNGTLYISNNNDSKKDQYNFNGGTLQIQTLHVRQWGEFNHNAASELDIVTSLNLGDVATGNSFFNLNGGEMKIGANLNIGVANNTGSGTFSFGNPATAKLTFTGGTGNGINIGGANTLVVPAGLVNPIVVPGQSIIGSATGGESIYQQDGGTVSFNNTFYIANSVNAGGETDKVILNGGTLNLNGPASTILLQTRGALIVNGGTLNAKNFNIGNIAGYVSESTGGVSNFAGLVRVNAAGDTTNDYFNVSGGTVNITGAGNDLELYGNSVATITGGQINIADDFLVGTLAARTTIVNQSGGLVQADALQLATVAGATGTYNLSGGSLKLNTLDLTNPGADAFNFSGGRLSAVNVDNLDNILNYTGGYLSPGLLGMPSTMTFNTGLVFPAAGGLEMDLVAPETFGGPNDLLVVGGDLTLDGVLNVGAIPSGVFPIITFTGTLNDLGMDVLFPLTQSIFVVMNEGGIGGTVYLQVLPIPEPSSMMLFVGLGGLGMRARRRQRRAA